MDAPDLVSQPWFDRTGYPWTGGRFPAPGGAMHFLDVGTGPVVVLVHGTPSWSYDMRHLVARLSRRFRVIAPDHVGFGLSERVGPVDHVLRFHGDNLRALLDHLRVERAALVVHDFGGPVALPLAVAQPERFTRLVGMNTWAWPFSVDPGFARQLPILRSGAMRWMYRNLNLSARVIVKQAWGTHSPLTALHHRHFTAQFPDAASREGTLGFLRALADETDHVAQLERGLTALAKHPWLVCWGEADGFVKPLHLDHWMKVMPGALVRRFPKAGHFVQDEAGPEVAEAVDAFLG